MVDQPSLPESTAQGGGNSGTAMRIVVLLLIAAVAALVIHFSPRLFSAPSRLVSDHPQLKTGGTSVIFVVTENVWKGKYFKDKGVDLICDSAGTTLGVTRMLDKTYSIAFTHAPVSAELRDKARKSGCEIVHVPLFLCGVVPAYHVEELKGKAPLNFTGEVLAGIFLGKISVWNDPALKAINPGVNLPGTKITVVHREDPSGTTQLFTDYLSAASEAWRERIKPPAADKVQWPVGVAANRNQGVATEIYHTDGAIGYIDRVFTSFQNIELDYGAVQNKDKSAFVRAEPANLTAAASAILGEMPADLAFDLIEKPGKESYPIAGVIYAVCTDRQSEGDRKQIVDFLRWAIHDGQADVMKTKFAPLPPEFLERIDHRLDAVKAL